MSLQFKHWFFSALFLSLVSFGSAILAQDFKPLFNGKDLSGWVLVNTPPETWKVDDGLLICTGKPIGEIRTDRMYQNFEMEVEWRHMVPKGNAGIFVWADDITSRGVPFHRSIEVQILENAYGNSQSHTTHGDIFPIHGAKMTPINGRGGGSRAFPVEERSNPSPKWNHYRIVCNDGKISLAVNGKVVTEGKEANPRKGYICLESEGGVVHYRNLKIKELPDTPIDQAMVAVSNRGYRSIYTGLNLDGWSTTEKGKSAWHVNDWVLRFDGSVAGLDSRLETTNSLTVAGCVLDFKFNEKSDSMKLHLPGASAATTLQIRASGDANYSSALQKTGSWNRIEISQEPGKLVVKINDQPTAVDGALGSGKLGIECSGPIELANVYVR
jgi:Domain of Unknown Function (DUF1080)